jgi:chromosome segregation ATPase
MAQDTDIQVENEPMVRRLEEQLRDAHAANAELRASKDDLGKQLQKFRQEGTEALRRLQQVEEISLKLKQAESFAQAAARKQRDAEAEACRLSDENEELQALLDALRAEAEQLTELNLKVQSAKHVGDLFGGAK